jgi:hypothetical protein
MKLDYIRKGWRSDKETERLVAKFGRGREVDGPWRERRVDDGSVRAPDKRRNPVGSPAATQARGDLGPADRTRGRTRKRRGRTAEGASRTRRPWGWPRPTERMLEQNESSWKTKDWHAELDRPEWIDREKGDSEIGRVQTGGSGSRRGPGLIQTHSLLIPRSCLPPPSISPRFLCVPIALCTAVRLIMPRDDRLRVRSDVWREAVTTVPRDRAKAAGRLGASRGEDT